MGGLTVRQAVWLLWMSVAGIYHHAEGGCSGMCCQGNDLTCSSLDWRSDRVYGTCYCDEKCARTKDCCFDYPTECLSQSCVVSEWSHWSGCAQLCQPSYRARRRRVERPAQNSGQPCPALEQRAGCMEYRDGQGQPCAQAQGPALITALEFTKARATHGAPKDVGFCVEFKVESLTTQCMVENKPHTRWMQYLREGYIVCVTCQPPAMSNYSRGCQGDRTSVDSNPPRVKDFHNCFLVDSEDYKRGQCSKCRLMVLCSHRAQVMHWQALGQERCSGTWRRLRRLQFCSCPHVHSFIFV